MAMRQPEQGFLAGMDRFTDSVAGAGNARAGGGVVHLRCGGPLEMGLRPLGGSQLGVGDVFQIEEGYGAEGRKMEGEEGAAPLISLRSEFPPGGLDQSLHGGKPHRRPKAGKPATERIECLGETPGRRCGRWATYCRRRA